MITIRYFKFSVEEKKASKLRWMMPLFVLLCLLGTSSAAPDPQGKVPSIEFVQARVWNNMKLQDFKLEGIIRTPKTIYPITLRTKGHELVYEFQDRPLQLRVVISPDASTVEKRSDSKSAWKPVTGKEKTQTILDSDITYEDLCLDFIRWEKVRPLGTDSIKTLPAWAFEATPNGESRYAKARYWISSEYYAFLRVDAYNAKNQVVKRVEVNGVQQIGKAYVIKEMQVSTLIPGRDISDSRTYIEIRTGKAGSSGI
jgi:hypothetical protein